MDGRFARPRFSFVCVGRGVARAFSRRALTASVVATRLPTHTNPAACIAAPRAPARRCCAAWPRGCPAARATAPDAARDRVRGAGSRPLRRSSGTAGGTPCANRSATRRTRRNSGAAATPFRPRGGARTRWGSSFGLGFMPALSMADSTAKFWSFFCSASFTAKLSRLAAHFCAAFLSCARSREDRALRKNVVTSSAKPVRSKERAGVGPVFRSSVTSVSPN